MHFVRIPIPPMRGFFNTPLNYLPLFPDLSQPALLSPCPFNGLNSAIERLRGYQRNVNAWALSKTLRQLESLGYKNYKPEQLRAELRKIYADYRTITEEEPFIDLANFEKYVVPKIYDWLK